ncbi:MAG: hypothetical protein EOO39_01390 [Cytophagaceae bacterium]|nr:MAG: hypothetical protein EOO39_01390 [Cytophagaceae bacterium]
MKRETRMAVMGYAGLVTALAKQPVNKYSPETEQEKPYPVPTSRMTQRATPTNYKVHPDEKQLRLAITKVLEPYRSEYQFDNGGDFRNRVCKTLEAKGIFDPWQNEKLSIDQKLIEFHMAIAMALVESCDRQNPRLSVPSGIRKQIEDQTAAAFLGVDSVIIDKSRGYE